MIANLNLTLFDFNLDTHICVEAAIPPIMVRPNISLKPNSQIFRNFVCYWQKCNDLQQQANSDPRIPLKLQPLFFGKSCDFCKIFKNIWATALGYASTMS